MGLKYTTQKTIDRAILLADYIVQCDREREDYLNQCDENGLDPKNYRANADCEGPHVYAVAYMLLEEVNNDRILV